MSTAKHKTFQIATIAIAIVILAFLGFFLLRSCSEQPKKIVEGIPPLIEAGTDALGKLSAAINTKTISTDYTSTATTLSGSNKLQVGEINQTELFRKSDDGTILGVPLPEVVISATAPVNYVFYLDLSGKWEFSMTDNQMTVVAPKLNFNKPSLDISGLEFDVRGSVFRKEDPVKDALVKEMTLELRRRAEQNVELIRATARREVENFIRAWIGKQYGVEDNIRIEVLFEDEVPEEQSEVAL